MHLSPVSTHIYVYTYAQMSQTTLHVYYALERSQRWSCTNRSRAQRELVHKSSACIAIIVMQAQGCQLRADALTCMYSSSPWSTALCLLLATSQGDIRAGYLHTHTHTQPAYYQLLKRIAWLHVLFRLGSMTDTTLIRHDRSRDGTCKAA